MRRFLKHPVISTVVGGLILSFLTWVFGYAPAVWDWIAKASVKIWEGITYKLNLPLWLVVIFAIPFILWILKTIRIYIYSSTSNHPIVSEIPRKKRVSLTDDELRVMQLFIEVDGKSLQMNDIKYLLGFPVLKIQQIVESLEDKQLIHEDNDFIHGTKLYLTRGGRDYMLGNEYSKSC